MLQSLDTHWKDHLSAMDHLRQGIHLRGYAQKNPKQEYKREAFNMFTALLENIKREVIAIISSFELRTQAEIDAIEEQRRQATNYTISMHHEDLAVEDETVDSEVKSNKPVTRSTHKIGRNDPCPCDSGKKYKQCHGRI